MTCTLAHPISLDILVCLGLVFVLTKNRSEQLDPSRHPAFQIISAANSEQNRDSSAFCFSASVLVSDS